MGLESLVAGAGKAMAESAAFSSYHWLLEEETEFVEKKMHRRDVITLFRPTPFRATNTKTYSKQSIVIAVEHFYVANQCIIVPLVHYDAYINIRLIKSP